MRESTEELLERMSKKSAPTGHDSNYCRVCNHSKTVYPTFMNLCRKCSSHAKEGGYGDMIGLSVVSANVCDGCGRYIPEGKLVQWNLYACENCQRKSALRPYARKVA